MRLTKIDALFLAAWLGSLLLAALIYLPGLPGAFLYDDIGSISNNAAIALKSLDLESLRQAALSAPIGGLLRPISTLSFALDAYLFGVSPGPFKVTNIVIHLAVGVVLWFLARELLRAYRKSTGASLDDRAIVWLSLATSTLWLVHPLNLTSVLYVVQRDNSLSALFTSAAVLSYLVGRRRMQMGTGGRLLIWALTPCLIVIGILCKENAALAPVYILAAEFTLLGFKDADGKPSAEVRWFFGLFLGLPLVAAAVLAAVKPVLFFGSYVGRDFTPYERVLSECRILLDYLRWAFIPDLRQLGLFHDDILPSRGLLDPATTLPSVIVVTALVVAGFGLRKRLPLLSFGLLWFFAGQLMESTVLPLELAFEHRNYLPLFGLLLGLVGTLYPLAAAQGRESLAKGLLAGGVLLLACTTAMRAADWQTELSFARSESRHHLASAHALAELQGTYASYAVASGDARIAPLAVEAAQRSEALDPGAINQEIGLAYMFAGLKDLPSASTHLKNAAATALSARASATQQLALETLLQMTSESERPLFPDMDLIFRHILQNQDFMRDVCFGADTWNTYGVFQNQIGDLTGALASLHKAISMCPKNVEIRMNFTRLLLDYGDTRDAAPQLEALHAVQDPRYRPAIGLLQQEYAADLAGQGKK